MGLSCPSFKSSLVNSAEVGKADMIGHKIGKSSWRKEHSSQMQGRKLLKYKHRRSLYRDHVEKVCFSLKKKKSTSSHKPDRIESMIKIMPLSPRMAA